MVCPKDTYLGGNDTIFDTECVQCAAPKLFTLEGGSTSVADCKFG